MSKSDDMRAMREARFAATVARPTLRLVPADGVVPGDAEEPATAAETSRPTRRRLEPAGAAPETAQPALCGHRAISGRTCTREAGHAARSHRYA